jgi:CDP-diacylglycerol--glycerol-3-phosphate 3-phosphatidyltransferase
VYRLLPNALTILRLLLAGVFFLVLNQYRYPHASSAILWWAMAVHILAALTDVADGFLARRWHAESAFGRIMDPFCDKVLNLGALIYLAGPRFVDPAAVQSFFNMISGVYPWMVVVMLARELLVTGIRGEMEAHGVNFGAKLSGKLKTLFQSVGIPFILGIVALGPNEPGHEWMSWVREFFAYGMVLTTVLSGIPYIASAAKMSRQTGTP